MITQEELDELMIHHEYKSFQKKTAKLLSSYDQAEVDPYQSKYNYLSDTYIIEALFFSNFGEHEDSSILLNKAYIQAKRQIFKENGYTRRSKADQARTIVDGIQTDSDEFKKTVIIGSLDKPLNAYDNLQDCISDANLWQSSEARHLNKEDARRVNQLIPRLTKNQAELMQYFLDGYSAEEIANVKNQPIGSVTKAMDRLAQKITEIDKEMGIRECI